MKAFTCMIFLIAGYQSMAQAKAPDTEIKSAIEILPSQQISIRSEAQDSSIMPNALKVTPQLTKKWKNSGNGSDIYILEGGMACAVPDSTFISKMPVLGTRLSPIHKRMRIPSDIIITPSK